MKQATLARHGIVAFLGATLGVALSQLGFTDYGELHQMFTLAEPRLFRAFGGGVTLLGLGFILLTRVGAGRTLARQPIHKGTIPGALLFGAGWAVCGACPAVPLVQLGEGKLPAFFTVAGVVVGVWLCRLVRARYLKWETFTCGQ